MKMPECNKYNKDNDNDTIQKEGTNNGRKKMFLAWIRLEKKATKKVKRVYGDYLGFIC